MNVTTSIRDDLRRLPWPVAAGLVAVAVVVLVVRVVALLVCLAADGVMRLEAVASSAAGIGPLASGVVVIEGEGWR
ncbi:MAG: hypothetical protein IRZ08_12530 [Frankia sp.]|nr:hypothetical protein [Frankia sp.]